MLHRSQLSQDGDRPHDDERRTVLFGALALLVLAATVALMVWLIVSVAGWLIAEPLGI